MIRVATDQLYSEPTLGIFKNWLISAFFFTFVKFH